MSNLGLFEATIVSGSLWSGYSRGQALDRLWQGLRAGRLFCIRHAIQNCWRGRHVSIEGCRIPGDPTWSDVSWVSDNRILQVVNLASQINPHSRVLLFVFVCLFVFAFDLL